MTKNNQLKQLTMAACLCLALGNAAAQDGAPVALSGNANFSSVSLSWQAPSSPVTIQWHDGEDYNGMDGKPMEAGGPNIIYAANRFQAGDIAAHTGHMVEAITFYEYRPVIQVNVQIYEDKQLVRDQKADLSNFVKDSWRTVELDEPYIIPEGKEVMFVARYMAGPNFTFVAITDRSPQMGKGDVYSYDGKTWMQGAVGDFLVTANVQNNFTGEPLGYNVYRDGTRLNDAPVTDMSYELIDEPDGQHTYAVAAIYDDGERLAHPVTLNVVHASSLAAPASTLTGETDELDGLISWTAPLHGGDILTWSGDQMGNHIGGTASSNTKVWIKQEFDRNDMLAFQDYNLNQISAYVAEKEILSATIFVMRDGKIVQSRNVPDTVVQAIQAPGWVTFDMGMPYRMTTGHTYAYGVYYTHTPKTHPVGVDNTTEVDVKGNSFSTSSPNSSSFNASNPTWKTLKSGNIPGNFMLRAHVTPTGQATPVLEVAGYDLYRDGTLLAQGLTDLDYIDQVEDPGIYNYRLVTRYQGGKVGTDMTLALTYHMPADYEAPLIVKSRFDELTKEVNLEWSAEAVELAKYGTPAYMVGFDEDMTMLYGTKFSVAELEPYVGYRFGSVKFGVAEAIDFSVQIRTGDNQLLWNIDITRDQIEPLAFYTLNIPEDVVIPQGQDIYLAYKATLPGGTSPILIDAGPLNEGGAMVSLTDGANWMRLGTINTTYNDYNIVIGATIMPAGTDAHNAAMVQLGSIDRRLRQVILHADDARHGVEATTTATHMRRMPAKAAKATPASYRVYRNNQLHLETEQTCFSEVLNKYGMVEYYVTTVFTNGWESPASKVVAFENRIAQLSQAPYDLQGELDGKDLHLAWTTPGEGAQEVNYMTDLSQDLALGFTKSSGGSLTSYQTIRFDVDTIPSLVGKTLTHIKFKLSAEVSAATVVVMLGDNILFEQEVELPVVGWNVVRLNQPYTIPDGLTLPLGLGYSATYTSGTRCLTLDPAPAIPMANDVYSLSLEAGYWYSLYNKQKQNYGWRISGVLQTPDQELRANRAPRHNVEAQPTFNIYRDGQLLAQGVTGTEYDVADALAGNYTVTAVNATNESAPSNVVRLVTDLRGDLTGDGRVDIADINNVINIMLGKAEQTTAADLTGDGRVDIADVNTIINIMLGK